MNYVQVAKVEVLGNGQMAVTPVEPDPSYQYLYRAGAGVEWVNAEGRFLSPSRYMLGAPFPLSPEQRFNNLAGALLSELAVRLVVSTRTEWVAVPSQVRGAIEAEYSAQLGNALKNGEASNAVQQFIQADRQTATRFVGGLIQALDTGDKL